MTVKPRTGCTNLRLAGAALGVLAALLPGACASKQVRSSTTPPTPTASSPSATTSTSTQAAGGGGTITVADANNGQTVTLHPGDHLRVVLSSTYWQLQPSSNPALLRAEGSPVTSPSPGCVPGAGCGTVAATYTAVAPGHVTLVATRTSCGEAMGCVGSSGHYQVDVVIAA